MSDGGQNNSLNNPHHGGGGPDEQIQMLPLASDNGIAPPPRTPPGEMPEHDSYFNYDGYQVVRGEYFAHTLEPCVTFADCKISFNKACVRKLPGVEYVQVLVNRRDRKLVIRPSSDDMKDSFTWLRASGKPRTITCRLFYAMLVDMMGWNPNYRYKLIGKLVHSQTELILVFDLNATEIFRRELQKTGDGEEKWRTSRKPVFPDEWKDQFGLPVEENQRVFQINIFDGYAVFGLKDKVEHKVTDSDDGTEQADEGRSEGGVSDAT